MQTLLNETKEQVARIEARYAELVRLMDDLKWRIDLLDPDRSLTLREAVAPEQNCPFCGGSRVVKKDGTKVLCPRCTVTGQF